MVPDLDILGFLSLRKPPHVLSLRFSSKMLWNILRDEAPYFAVSITKRVATFFLGVDAETGVVSLATHATSQRSLSLSSGALWCDSQRQEL